MSLKLPKKLPKSWFDVSIEQYQELIQIEKEKENLSKTEYFIEKLALFLDLSPEDSFFDEIEADDLFKIINGISWTNSPIPVSSKEKEFNGMLPKKFEALCLGEFIDLEHFMENPDDNLHKIAAVLYKQSRVNKWGNLEIEPYEYDSEKRAEEFLEAPVPPVYNLVSSYVAWRKNFLDNYQELFQGDEPDQDEEEELEGYEVVERQKQLQKEKVLIKWSWENMIWNLSQEDITKMKSIFGTEVILVFNMLSMKKSLDK
jgi:hypothetical protein